MNILIAIVILLIGLVTICMMYIINYHTMNKKQEKKILYIYEQLNSFRNDIWELKHPPKYKIGDTVFASPLSSNDLKVPFYNEKKSFLIRGIKLYYDVYYSNSIEPYEWQYQLDDGNPKYEPKWYNESSIHI